MIRNLCFPQDGYIGVAADFADLYAGHYEPPKEFFYMDMLALIGAALSGRVRADIGVLCQPRLYTCKIGASAWFRKSTSTRFAAEILRSAIGGGPAMPEIVAGVASAEGLVRVLELRPGISVADVAVPDLTTRRVVLTFDELRRFEAKASIQGSALLPMVNELFDANRYQNRTKNEELKVDDGHLVFTSNSRDETWQGLYNAWEFKDIGFLNRVFLVVATDTDKRIPRPTAPPASEQQKIVSRLAALFAALPPLNADGAPSSELLLPFTSQAEQMWDAWYYALGQSPETARLDAIGSRLLSLLAFTSGKQNIDEDLMRATLALLEYQRQVRTECAPIEANNPAAKMEERIRRVLAKRGPLSERELRSRTNADRTGIEVFGKALKALKDAGDIQRNGSKWSLVP